jgi:hypothetical protein
MPSLRALFLCAVLLGSAATSCQKTSGPVAARDDMAMVPRETEIVFMANLTRARSAPMWKKLTDVLNKDPASKQKYDEFVAKCKFDPIKQLDSAFLALPQYTEQNREFAVILRGTFDKNNLASCVRQTAKEQAGKDLQESAYQNHQIYSSDGQDGVFTILSDHVAVLAGKEWIKKVIDLHDNRTKGDGAKDNQALSALVKRTQQGDALWGVGLVPPAVGEKLKNNPQLGSAGSLKSIFGSIDFAKGLLLHLNLDLGSDKDAADTAAKVKEQLAGAKKNPSVMLMGMSRYFDGIKVDSRQSTFSTTIEMDQQQVEDLSQQLSGLLSSGLLGGRPTSLAAPATSPTSPATLDLSSPPPAAKAPTADKPAAPDKTKE